MDKKKSHNVPNDIAQVGSLALDQHTSWITQEKYLISTYSRSRILHELVRRYKSLVTPYRNNSNLSVALGGWEPFGMLCLEFHPAFFCDSRVEWHKLWCDQPIVEARWGQARAQLLKRSDLYISLFLIIPDTTSTGNNQKAPFRRECVMISHQQITKTWIF